jgi:hypothetical protein
VGSPLWYLWIYWNSRSKVCNSWCQQKFCGQLVEKSLIAHHHSDCTHYIYPNISGKKVSMLLLQRYEFIGWKHWKRNKELSWVERKACSRDDTSIKQPTLWLMMLHSPFVCLL